MDKNSYVPISGRCKLTKPDDKLVAGIAETLHYFVHRRVLTDADIDLMADILVSRVREHDSKAERKEREAGYKHGNSKGVKNNDTTKKHARRY